MSGAEAGGLVLGLISGTITLVEAIKQVYDAAKDQQGLPAAFREVAQRLPLVRDILTTAKATAEEGLVGVEASKAAESILQSCEKRVKKLEKIFRKVLPDENSSRLDRYYRAVRSLGKDGKVELLMRGILDDLSLLSIQCGIGIRVHAEKINEAIKAMSTTEPSVPDCVFEETTYTNNNMGDGTQNNFNTSGGESYNNVGSGNQFMGPIGNLSFGRQ
jgi:hypothetical protein